MTENNTVFEVQTYTICQGWINCWTIDDLPQTFEAMEDAQAEIDEFFADLDAEILAGDRQPDDGYSREDYRIFKIISE